MLDAAAIARLRAMLGGPPDRYCFATVMQRWAAEVLGDPLADISHTQAPEAAQFEWPSGSTGWEVDALARQLRGLPPGRPRADAERDAAILLGIVFYEYTGSPPSRDAWNDYSERTKLSLFRKFADEAFLAIGLKATPEAFRHAAVRWEKSPKRAMRHLLWGGLASKRVRQKSAK